MGRLFPGYLETFILFAKKIWILDFLIRILTSIPNGWRFGQLPLEALFRHCGPRFGRQSIQISLVGSSAAFFQHVISFRCPCCSRSGLTVSGGSSWRQLQAHLVHLLDFVDMPFTQWQDRDSNVWYFKEFLPYKLQAYRPLWLYLYWRHIHRTCQVGYSKSLLISYYARLSEAASCFWMSPCFLTIGFSKHAKLVIKWIFSKNLLRYLPIHECCQPKHSKTLNSLWPPKLVWTFPPFPWKSSSSNWAFINWKSFQTSWEDLRHWKCHLVSYYLQWVDSSWKPISIQSSSLNQSELIDFGQTIFSLAYFSFCCLPGPVLWRALKHICLPVLIERIFHRWHRLKYYL